MNALTNKQVNNITTNIEKKFSLNKRKVKKLLTSLGAKMIALGLGLGLFTALSLIALINVTVWYRTHDIIFSSPIKVIFQVPIKIIKKKPEAVKVLVPVKEVLPKTEQEIIMDYKYGKVLWKIYQLESQRGKTDYCRLNKLGYGGFGVMYDKKIVCYESFEIAVERAEYWLLKLGLEKNLIDALCIWNLGYQRNQDGKHIPYQNCNYYQHYMAL